MKLCLALLMFPASPSFVFGQSPETARATVPDVRALGDSVAGHGSALDRTRRLVYRINDRFDWSYTDYERRTPEEENLHAFTSDIAARKAVYDSLVAEAGARGLAWR